MLKIDHWVVRSWATLATVGLSKGPKAELPLRSCLSFQVLEKTRLLQQNKVQLVEAQMGQWSLGAHKTKCYGVNVPASVHLVCWKEPVLYPMGASVTWVNPWPARQVKPFQHPFLHTWHEFKGGMCPHSIFLTNAFATRLNASMTRRRCANSI